MMHICIPKMKLFRCSCCSMFLENQDIFRDDASAKHTVTMGSYRVRNVLKNPLLCFSFSTQHVSQCSRSSHKAITKKSWW